MGVVVAVGQGPEFGPLLVPGAPLRHRAAQRLGRRKARRAGVERMNNAGPEVGGQTFVMPPFV
jgi:hypothetical protein